MMRSALLDTDTLSEIIKGRRPRTIQHARAYLDEHPRLAFSLITRYEVLRGIRWRQAAKQEREFEAQCRDSWVVPITDEIVVRAAGLYARLRAKGATISDADLLIAATAQEHDLVLVTNNVDHFRRIEHLVIESWG